MIFICWHVDHVGTKTQMENDLANSSYSSWKRLLVQERLNDLFLWLKN